MIYTVRKHKHAEDEDDLPKILPEGSVLRVPMSVLDSAHRAIIKQLAMDGRVCDNLAAGRATLKAMQRDADQAAAWADHFTAQREAQADNSAYGKHCHRISEAWQQVPA